MLGIAGTRQVVRSTRAAVPGGSTRGRLSVMPPPVTEPRAFSSLKDLIALATEKRDIKLKSDLEALVRPIRVAPGRFELAARATLTT